METSHFGFSDEPHVQVNAEPPEVTFQRHSSQEDYDDEDMMPHDFSAPQQSYSSKVTTPLVISRDAIQLRSSPLAYLSRPTSSLKKPEEP
jgi:hypothetical protein